MAACTPVAPVDPTVTQATCVNGAVTVPTVVPATGPAGVTYALDPPAPYDPGTDDYTVTVTATLADGQEWGRCRRGGRRSTPSTATFTVDVDRRVV